MMYQSAKPKSVATMMILLSRMLALQCNFAVAWVFAPSSRQSDHNNLKFTRRNLHTAVISPFATSSPVIPADDEDSDKSRRFIADLFTKDDNPRHFAELCELLNATPVDLLRFDSQNGDGVRGVYLNRAVQAGDILLSLPLDSCLVDQQSPKWLNSEVTGNPDKWATRLAASWIDLYLNHELNEGSSDGISLWMSLLPDPELLKASLPVHWPEETVQNARSTSLEIAVDSAYFSRAEAVQDLVESLEGHKDCKALLKSVDDMQNLAHRALDLVQTRSCRLDSKNPNDGDSNDFYRVLAPGFDFINHGAQCDADARLQDDGCANAQFEMEIDNGKECLVVRALTDLKGDEEAEVLIDYGFSARPAWKCLMSYGFVPKYNQQSPDDNSAEVYMFGKRYDITTETIPFEMVEAASAAGADFDEDRSEGNAPIEEVQLTPEIARKIADRVQEVGFFLLLEPDLDPYEAFDESEELQETSLDPTEVLSHTLAASLRWSQHKVLLTCASKLEEFAEGA